MLQSCLFEDFWKKDVAFANDVPGFLESVRAYILMAVCRSCSVVSTDVFKAKLNVSDQQVADIVAGMWPRCFVGRWPMPMVCLSF